MQGNRGRPIDGADRATFERIREESARQLSERRKPPRDIETMLDRLLGGADRWDVKVITWPGREAVKVGIRLLSDADVAEADIATLAWARDVGLGTGVGRGDDWEYKTRYAAEILSRALVDPDTKAPICETVKELRDRITRSELDLLMVAYNDHQEACAPYPSQIQSQAEFEEIVNALKRTRSETILARCAPSTLRGLALYMVDQLARSIGSSSSTTISAG